MRAVAVIVIGNLVVVDEVKAVDHAAFQVGMVGIHAGINDAHRGGNFLFRPDDVGADFPVTPLSIRQGIGRIGGDGESLTALAHQGAQALQLRDVAQDSAVFAFKGNFPQFFDGGGFDRFGQAEDVVGLGKDHARLRLHLLGQGGHIGGFIKTEQGHTRAGGNHLGADLPGQGAGLGASFGGGQVLIKTDDQLAGDKITRGRQVFLRRRLGRRGGEGYEGQGEYGDDQTVQKACAHDFLLVS